MFINRPVGRVVSIDTNNESVSAQPSNAIIIKVMATRHTPHVTRHTPLPSFSPPQPWTGDPHDTTLIDLIPLLEVMACCARACERVIALHPCQWITDSLFCRHRRLQPTTYKTYDPSYVT
jgi:hypothetical protein